MKATGHRGDPGGKWSSSAANGLPAGAATGIRGHPAQGRPLWPHPMVRALCYGSLNPDLIHTVGSLPMPGDDIFSERADLVCGGGGANAATALATWDVETTLIGNELGTDPLGLWMLDRLARPHLDLRWVRSSEDAGTPHCVVLITADGDRTIVSTGYGRTRWQPVPDRAWHGVDVVLVDGYSAEAGSTVAARAVERGIPVVGLDAAGATIEHSTIVVRSRHEHPDPESTRRLAEDGHDVVLTDGAGPVSAWWDGDRLQVRPPVITAADSTGAGDVFAAMIALGLGSGWESRQTLRMATAAGTLLALRGRAAGMPALQDIASLAEDLSVH